MLSLCGADGVCCMLWVILCESSEEVSLEGGPGGGTKTGASHACIPLPHGRCRETVLSAVLIAGGLE